ncbi:MAG: hypothetical protein J6M06_03680 [Synergistaceae bacterium]|nr:hypothetical protein [Synergistaceae bacterium]
MKKLLLLSLAGSVACVPGFLNMAEARNVFQISDSQMQDEYDGQNLGKFQSDFNNIAAKSSGVPVGTVISWPIASMPEDAENWLECDGKAVPFNYELAKIMTHTPDYRGMFLRGKGGKSGALGEKQHESVHISESAGISMSLPFNMGAHRPGGGSAGYSASVTNVGSGNSVATFPLIIESVEEETRPANVAVRYLIRAQ